MTDSKNQALEVEAAATLSERERRFLLRSVSRALREHFVPSPTGAEAITSHQCRAGDPLEVSPSLERPWGVFVSIHRGDSLRGCIGQITSRKPLWQAAEEMAIAAATRDQRFDQVAVDELPHLLYEISVLGPLQGVPAEARARLPSKLLVGVHGVQIRRGRESGLLLPQVAEKFGWTAEEFLAETAGKAGLEQDAWRDPQAEVLVFRTLWFSGRS